MIGQLPHGTSLTTITRYNGTHLLPKAVRMQYKTHAITCRKSTDQHEPIAMLLSGSVDHQLGSTTHPLSERSRSGRTLRPLWNVLLRRYAVHAFVVLVGVATCNDISTPPLVHRRGLLIRMCRVHRHILRANSWNSCLPPILPAPPPLGKD